MTDPANPPVGPYRLPPLPYSYDALEPVIDAETMRLHHDKHHQAYIDALNHALEKHPEWLGRTIDEVLARLHEIPEDIRQTVRDQGGGHANHAFFWTILTPNGPGKPSGELAAAIDRDFGSFGAFKAAFEEAGLKHFGSGWVVLAARPDENSQLHILTLPNQDSVLSMDRPAVPIIACDLWEHAYYLKHQNRRAEWLAAWWDVVHWQAAAERFEHVRAGRA